MVQCLDGVFTALAHPVRRLVLTACSQRTHSITELTNLCRRHHDSMTLTGMRKHLAVLEDAGLLHRHKEGRTVWCRADLRPLSATEDYVATLYDTWNSNLDHLASHLENR